MLKLKIKSRSMWRTIKEGAELGKQLEQGDVVVLAGELGAGKTVFAKGIAKGLGVKDWKSVNSPTFVIMSQYEGRFRLYHFDFYRLSSVSELRDTGFFEYLSGDGVTVVEWGDKFPELFSDRSFWVDIKYINEKERLITIKRGVAKC